ncbi:MAG: hypothetical protein WDO18_07015 [Acidobacteriota bacterium]
MELAKIIAELRRECDAITQALSYLEHLARGQGKRRGRPPAFLSGAGAVLQARKPFSEATKKKMALAQRKRWATYRKSKEKDAA